MCFMVRAVALHGVLTDEYGAMAEGSQQGINGKEVGEKPGARSLTTDLT